MILKKRITLKKYKWKPCRICFLILLACSLTFTFTFAYAQKQNNKKALIIAVGDYDYSHTGWKPLSSANDVVLIKAALRHQGFKDANITILSDPQSTKSGIINALRNFTEKIEPGDYAVIHYSGHGQQIYDFNKDEIDGLDEAIIPLDAHADFSSSYSGEAHITDDDLGFFIKKIRAKAGKDGQVLVLIDACHSGTATRGSTRIRGANRPFIPPDADLKAILNESVGFGINEAQPQVSADKLAAFVTISGSQHNQSNYETETENGQSAGSLSYAFSKAVHRLPEKASYQILFSEIQKEMSVSSPYQTPAAEGDLNMQVFGGEILPAAYFHEITKIPSNTSLLLNHGFIHNLNYGDEIGIYPNSVLNPDNNTPLDTGKIVELNKFSALIKTNKAHGFSNPKAYKAFTLKENLESRFIKVFIDVENKRMKNDISEAVFSANRILIPAESAPASDYTIRFSTESNFSVCVIHTKTQETAHSIPLNKDNTAPAIKTLARVMKNHSQGVFIRNLELNDPYYNISLDFVPVNLKKKSNGQLAEGAHGNFIIQDTLSIETFLQNGVPVFTSRTSVMLKLTNTGYNSTYYNIIEIQPDGIINPILPFGNITKEECYLDAGQSIILPNYVIRGFAPPYGKQTFKVFTDKKPIDLSLIISQKGKINTRDIGGISGLLNSSYQTRGTASKRLNSISYYDTGSIHNFFFITKQ